MARTTVQEIFTLFLALNIRTFTKFESQNTPCIGGGAGGAGGSVAPSPPPHKQITNIGRKNPPSTVLVPKDTCTDVFDITCDMADFKGHIFCPQTTYELSKKHHDAGSPKNCLLLHCDRSKYGHTRHCEDCKSRKGKILRAVKNFNGTFITPLLGFCFLLLFLFFVCFCFMCCITNLYCISLEEHPIKLWKKKYEPPHPSQVTNVPPSLPYNGLTTKQQIF